MSERKTRDCLVTFTDGSGKKRSEFVRVKPGDDPVLKASEKLFGSDWVRLKDGRVVVQERLPRIFFTAEVKEWD